MRKNKRSNLSKIVQAAIISAPLLYGCSLNYHIGKYEIDPNAIYLAEKEFRGLLEVIDTNRDNIISKEETDAAIKIFKIMGGIEYIKEKISDYIRKE